MINNSHKVIQVGTVIWTQAVWLWNCMLVISASESLETHASFLKHQTDLENIVTLLIKHNNCF